MNHNGDCGCPLCMEYGGTRNWERLPERMDRLTPEQIATAMESMPTDVLEWGVRFESLGKPEEL